MLKNEYNGAISQLAYSPNTFKRMQTVQNSSRVIKTVKQLFYFAHLRGITQKQVLHKNS